MQYLEVKQLLGPRSGEPSETGEALQFIVVSGAATKSTTHENLCGPKFDGSNQYRQLGRFPPSGVSAISPGCTGAASGEGTSCAPGR